LPSSTEVFRQRCSEHLGHSLPVWPWRSLNRLALPVFLARCPCPWMRLLERSSPEVQPSFMVPTRHPRPRITGSNSLGVSFPYSASSIGDPRPSQFPTLAPHPFRPLRAFRAGIPPAAPKLPATVPPSGFFNLSVAFFSPLPSHHFQAGNAHGVSPFRGFPSHAAPYGSSPPACPLDVSPSVKRFRPKRKLPRARAAP